MVMVSISNGVQNQFNIYLNSNRYFKLTVFAGSPLVTPTASSSSSSSAGSSGTPTIEALLLRRSSNQDPSFQQMKMQFSVDFDSTAPGALKLHNLIQRLRKWIKILEGKCKLFPK